MLTPKLARQASIACGLATLLSAPAVMQIRSARPPSSGDAAPPLIVEQGTGDGDSTNGPAIADGRRYLLFANAGCPACTSHLELLAVIVESLEEPDRTVVRSRIRVIEQDDGESPHTQPSTLPTVLDRQGINFDAFGVTAVPTGFLIDDGVVAGAHHGGIRPERVDAVIQWLAAYEGRLDTALGDREPDEHIETAHRARAVEPHGDDS